MLKMLDMYVKGEKVSYIASTMGMDESYVSREAIKNGLRRWSARSDKKA